MKTNKFIVVVLFGLLQAASVFAQTYNYYYTYDEAGNRIELISPILCSYFCGCPDDASDWLSLSSEIGTSLCGAGKCKVTASVTIPPEYDCYSFYSYFDGTVESPLYGSLSNITNREWCINSGENFSLTVYLYRSMSDQNPCVLQQTVSCSINCCDYINVNFIPTTPNGSNCCWIPNITTENGLICDLNNIIVNYFDSNNNPIIPESNGTICLSGAEGSHQIDYTIVINGQVCGERTTTLTCGMCDCPPDYILNSWVSLEVDKYSATCPAGQCAVRPRLEIPPEYAGCYSHYDIAYIRTNAAGNNFFTDFTGTPSNIPSSGDLAGLPNCIPAGEKIQFQLRLFSNGSPLDYCDITSETEYCTKIENQARPQPCDPNGDPWLGFGTVTVTIGPCTYVVSFQYRKTGPPNYYQDIQLLTVESNDFACPTAGAEDIFKAALPKAIDYVLDKEADYKPQKYDSSPCYDMWRVFQNSCWARWQASNQTSLFYIWVPCQSECCARKLRICRTAAGIRVEDLGFALQSGTFNCSAQQVPPPSMPSNISYPQNVTCKDENCDIYTDIWIDHGHVSREYDFTSKLSMLKQGFYSDEANRITFRHQMYNDNENLNIIVAQSVYENVTVSVYDLNSKEIASQNYKTHGGDQILTLDISNLSNGVYIYNITSNSMLIGVGKFIIIK